VIFIKIGKLILGKNNDIKRENYEDRKSFYFDKNTDIVPKRKNRLICIVFNESRGCSIILRKFHNKLELDYFKYRNGIYIIDNEAIHITSNGCRIAFYLEGISTPIKLSNVEHITETIEYTDLYGKKQKSVVEKIKGLKFDSKILDTFTNRRFAELFTKQDINNFQMFILIIGIITMITSVIACIVSYVRVS
jgi:hypothetical protein